MENEGFKKLEGQEPRGSRIRNKILHGLPYFGSMNHGEMGTKVDKI